MKKWILYILFIVACIVPNNTPALASSYTQEELLKEMQTILARLYELRVLETYEPIAYSYETSERSLEPSIYYKGSYEAIYLVDGGELVPYRSTITNSRDVALWKLLRTVFGEETTKKYIREFRLYDDRDAKHDAFVEQQGEAYWIVGVNLATVDLYDSFEKEAATELFVHEYAHILYHYEYETALKFENRFWEQRSRNPKKYVSSYAMKNSEEDFAETFMYFVLGIEPEGEDADQKINFFYDSDMFWDIRKNIRHRLSL